MARAALLGARGNSGVILSQLIRGAAEELVSRPGELIDPVLLGAAMARAAQRAYASVRAPAEGTMLTVMRDMAAHVASRLAHDAPRLGPDAEGDEQQRVLADILEEAIVAGEASVRRGPELLPVLREAGVVDAGGYGVIVIFAGVVAALRGEEAPALAHHAPGAHQPSRARLLARSATARTSPSPATQLDAAALRRAPSRRWATRCSSSATRRR